ncbi:MAG: hypothetical protein ACREJ3_05000, partial [Polyangiaceae bacterium]
SGTSPPAFEGYDYHELGLDPHGPSEVCLVYHFRGREGCAYGQDADGQAPAGASPCKTPAGQSVVGPVAPQCADRQASQVVFWSCRCANAQGQTNDGDSYCTCPSNMSCVPTVSSLGTADPSQAHLAGAYCILPSAAWDGGPACTVSCDPMTAPCP